MVTKWQSGISDAVLRAVRSIGIEASAVPWMTRGGAGSSLSSERKPARRDAPLVRVRVGRWAAACEVVGQRVNVVGGRWPVGATVATTVVGDAAESSRHQVRQLVTPHVAVEGPGVREYDRLVARIVGVEKRKLFCSLDIRHGLNSC